MEIINSWIAITLVEVAVLLVETRMRKGNKIKYLVKFRIIEEIDVNLKYPKIEWKKSVLYFSIFLF